MKVRKKTVCHTCRKRKVRCDGKHPTCSQCVASKRHCEGYPEVLFVPVVSKETLELRNSHGALPSKPTHQCPPRADPSILGSTVPILQPAYAHTGSSVSSDSLLKRQLSGLNDISAHPSLPTIAQHTTFLILHNYLPYNELQRNMKDYNPKSPRICGAWVSALPEIAAGATDALGECLDSAMKALALSITAYKTGRNLLRPIASCYEHSLRLLRNNLQLAGSGYKNEQAAAIMCLTLLEVLSPIDPNTWLVHVDGVSELVRSSSPEAFSTGVQHILFVGFRPLLILKSFIRRKGTFLAREEWIQKPFQHHPAAPLQSLLGLAAAIPGILEKFDALDGESLDAAKERLAELEKARANLETWTCSFVAESPVPLYWRRTNRDAEGCHDKLLWFRDLSTANVFTYLWSFQILCLSHIQILLAQFPGLEWFDAAMTVNMVALRNLCIELSIQIFQSVEYLFQEDFMLYGPSSAGFPFYTARKTLELDAQGRAVLQRLDKTVIARSDSRRIHFLSATIDATWRSA